MILAFRYMDRVYGIDFAQSNLIQLIGNSGTGKSLFVSDVRENLVELSKTFGTINIVDYKYLAYGTVKFEKLIENNPKLVIIDNADIILSKELDQKIAVYNVENVNKVYWIIIGRKSYKCRFYEQSIREIKSIYNNKYSVYQIFADNESIDNDFSSYFKSSGFKDLMNSNEF